MDSYSEGHLFVAAIRLLQHQKNVPPSLEDVCAMLETTPESGHAVCRSLKKAGIIETLEDPYTIKLLVAELDCHREATSEKRIEETPTIRNLLRSLRAPSLP